MGILNSLHILCDLFILLALVCLTKQENEGFVLEVSQNFDDKLSSSLEQHILSYHNLELAYKAYAAYFDRADVDLPGFRKFFRRLEDHALKNAITMTTYINKRGGPVRFPEAKLSAACEYISTFDKSQNDTKPRICCFQSTPKAKEKVKKQDNSWPNLYTNKNNDVENLKEDDHKYWKQKSGLHGLEDALALEKYINMDLIKLVGQAKRHNDPHTKITIETFMEEQVNAIKEVADLINRLKQYIQEDYPLGEYLLDRELDK